MGLIFGAFFSGRLQCCLMIIATLLFLAFLIKWKPFSLKLDSFLNILATFILIVLYVFCLVFSFLDEVSFQTERRIIGYVFIALVLGFFVFTCLLVFISKVRECVNKSKKRKKKPMQEVFPIANTTLTETDTKLRPESPPPSLIPRMSMFQHRMKPNPERRVLPSNYAE